MAPKTRTIDPVCGMEVDPGTAVAVEYASRRYHFCETACAETFREDPERWVDHQSGGSRQRATREAGGSADAG